MTGSIHFTDEARRYLTPRSADELPRRKAKDRGALWAELRDAARLVLARRTWKATSPALVGPLAEAHAILAQDGEPAAEPSPAAWAVLFRLAFSPADGARGLAYLAARAGLPRALDALLDACGLDTEVVPGAEGRLHARPPRWPLLGSGVDELVLRAPADVRDAVEALAAERWPGASLLPRMVIVEALPHRHDLANATVPAWLTHPTRGGEGWRVLVARIDELALCKPLIDDAISANVVDLVRTFGERALPVLADALERAKDPHAYKHLSRAVSLYDDPRAAQALAAVATRSVAQPFVLDFFQRHPGYAEGALGPMAKGRSKGAQAVAELLARVTRASAPTGELAPRASSSSSLHPVLAQPPWRLDAGAKKKKGAGRPIVVIERALEVPFESRIVPDPSTDARVLADRRSLPRFDDEAARTYVAGMHEPGPGLSVQGRWHQLPDAHSIALYNAYPAHRRRFVWMAQEAMAYFGLAVLPGLLDDARRSLGDEHARPTWAMRVIAPSMALVLLEGAADDDAAPLVGGWLSGHFDAALAGILPAAVGPLGPSRARAERGLLELARLRGEAPILALAAELGEDVTAAVREVLASALTIAGPAKAPKLPASLRLAELPPVRLRGATDVIDPGAMEALCVYLASSSLALRHPALAEIARACEPRDLAELGWALARGFELAGGKKRGRWMIDALAPLADDDVVRRVLPGVKDARAFDVLGAIGTDAAAVELLGPIEKGKQHVHAARAALERIAAARDVSVEELEESLAPTFLEGTTMSFTLGGEAYTLALDEHFALAFVRADGKRLDRLPPARDDEGAAGRHVRARVAELTADVALLVPRRLRLLERRMIRGGAIARADFEARYLRDPLWAPVARRIVWSIVDGAGAIRATFRVAEDGSPADEHDHPLVLADEARVGVPHPFQLADESRARWAQLLHDYAIVQPFPQIGRALPRLSEAELAGSQVERPTSGPASERGGGPLDLPHGVTTAGSVQRRVGLGDFRELALRATAQPPFVASVSLSRAVPGSPRESPPLSELGALLVAEHLAALGAS
jgi:hypothetical protein